MKDIPKFVGLDLAPLPFESLRSAASRFAWRNGIVHGTLKTQYNGVVLKFSTSRPPEEMTDRFALHLLTGWPQVDEDEGNLYRNNASAGFNGLAMTLRFCPICLQECYHSYLFQWRDLHSCPMHGCQLSMHCVVCGAAVVETILGDAIGHLGYRCTACQGPLAGAAPDLELHLVLRQQANDLEARLKELNGQIKLLYQRVQPIRAARTVLAAQCRGGTAAWGDKAALLRALKEIVCNEGQQKGVIDVLGVTFIRWQVNINSKAGASRRSWHQITQSLLPVYLATRRLLERWIFSSNSRSGATAEVCERFALSGNGSTTLDWAPLQLAYVLFRFTQEGCGFVGGQPVTQLKSTSLVVPPWDIAANMPRVAHRAWLLAAFGTLHALIRKNRGVPIDQILQIAQLPGAIVPSFVEKSPASTSVTGGAFFPTIAGMPLPPFVRNARPRGRD